jgi:hypothetical protein
MENTSKDGDKGKWVTKASASARGKGRLRILRRSCYGSASLILRLLRLLRVLRMFTLSLSIMRVRLVRLGIIRLMILRRDIRVMM